ncbi:MAG: 50S ribosomal protein L5 [Candidatus Moranbacteria bacterium]|nr:50S ribosomal protein L5 [Candidatus Moranbacteria bacterium]
MKELKTTKEIYRDSIKDLQKDLGFSNAMMVPKITKIVVNAGIGKISKESDKVDEVFESLKEITGQNPIKTKIKKSIAGFKVRENQDVGVKVTLRGRRMWDFMDRLINGALPRVRDFQGITLRSIDNSGNLNIGIKEHAIFPEIVAEKVRHSFGFQITVVSTAENKEDAEKLYRKLGFPLQKEN